MTYYEAFAKKDAFHQMNTYKNAIIYIYRIQTHFGLIYYNKHVAKYMANKYLKQ